MSASSVHCDRPGLLPLEAAIQQLNAVAREWGTRASIERVPVAEALGLALAEPIVSSIAVPGFDNSAMDGYALNLSQWQCLQSSSEPCSMPISARITAGDSPGPLHADSAVRIFTGAAVPSGADIVVMQEDCKAHIAENGTRSVTLNMDAHSAKPQQNIRPAGQDVQLGDALLDTGRRLRAEDMGLLSSVGVTHVSVYRPLKVAIIATGDELVEPDGELSFGQIYNSNTGSLIGLLNRMNMQVLPPFYAPDDAEKTQQVFSQAAEQADVLITTGGVSVGEEDNVRSVIQQDGALDIWRLAIKPGKPFALGRYQGKPILGLPGNPAAVVVTFYQLVRPFLHRVQGSECLPLMRLSGRADFSNHKAIGRTEFLRARFVDGVVSVHPNQSSGVLSSTSWGDGFACVPAGVQVQAGDAIEFVGVSTLLGQL